MDEDKKEDELSDADRKDGSKTLFYMIETINVLVDNQKILLKRLQQLEEQFYKMDDDNNRTIN
tara:strand:+ start:1303 stop:1491 length:189 start_codon:yes stop_codon:yes gene_type:complete